MLIWRFTLAGADPFEGDTPGRLKLTKPGYVSAILAVLDYCAAAGIPVATTMAGGYAKNVNDAVDIHFQTAQGYTGSTETSCAYRSTR
ncbi:MAG: hypothetical protein U0528_03735 [Anaerolineae bacterium]